MGKITHCSRIFGDLREMDEIPSEYIEPYIQTYISMTLESVGFGMETPSEARERLKGIDRFVSIFCGLHARLATQNEVNRFCRLTDEQMIDICKKVVEDESLIES